MLAERDPAKLPWKQTWASSWWSSRPASSPTARKAAQAPRRRRQEGASSRAPAKRPDITIVLGVNDEHYDPAAPRDLERLLHHQLPGADGQGAARQRSGSSTAS